MFWTYRISSFLSFSTEPTETYRMLDEYRRKNVGFHRKIYFFFRISFLFFLITNYFFFRLAITVIPTKKSIVCQI